MKKFSLRSLRSFVVNLFLPSYYYASEFSPLEQIFLAERLRIPQSYIRATNSSVRRAHSTNTFVTFMRFVVKDCSPLVAALPRWALRDLRVEGFFPCCSVPALTEGSASQESRRKPSMSRMEPTRFAFALIIVSTLRPIFTSL